MKKLLPIVFTLLTTIVYSQNCTQLLNQAEDDYEEGRLLGIPARITGCLDNHSFSKEEEVRARKLLALVYIFTDQEAQAEIAMINLLKVDPEHRLDPQVDPAELFFLYDQFRTEPIFRISFKAGLNTSNVVVIEDYATNNLLVHDNFYNGTTPDGDDSYTVPGDSSDVDYNANSTRDYHFWAELLFQKEVYEGVDVSSGVQFRTSSYSADSYVNQVNINNSIVNSQTYLRIPIQASYTLWSSNRDKILLPYGFLGGSFDYLMKANLTGSRIGGTTSTIQGEIDLIETNQVNRVNYSLTAGVGLKISFKTHFFTVEGRYDTGRRNYINGDERYTNSNYTFDLAYVEPALSLDFISVSLGYTLSIYRPKKY